MTSVAVEWATLSTPEFVAWTRLAEVDLPFPLSTGAQAYVVAPERAQIQRTLAERKLADSPVLDAARAAFADPRLCVYAVRVTPDAVESKFVAVAGQGEEAVLILLDPSQVAVRQIADTDLAASVVGSMPRLPVLHVPTVEVSLRGLQEIDAAIAAGASQRVVQLQMGQVGVPQALIALHEQSAATPGASGALGAVARSPQGSDQHSTRSATWREYEQGALLQVERGSRQGEPMIMMTPFTPDALFRAAVDAIGSVYESRSGHA
jgi:EspG family